VPDLLKKLIVEKGWSEEDVRKVAGKNLLRVFEAVERVN
jgi:microsomal dipeptidase-like Zn-dependent dipeptidase